MRLFVSYGLILLSLTVSGCVSLSTYNERVAEVENLKKDVASLEAARNSLDGELKQFKEALAKLRQQHEDIKTQSVAAAADEKSDKTAITATKKEFANDLDWLAAKLNASEARVKELAAALAAQEEAAKKAPVQDAGAEKEQRLNAMSESLQAQEANVVQLKAEVARLSQQRTVSDEKERAATAVRSALAGEIANGEVVVKELRDKMIVMLPEQIIFESGSATITKKGESTLKLMAKVLRKVGNNQIRVEGHTDSAPIGPKIIAKFPTNWDLAAARATNVLKHLQYKEKLDPKLLAMVGYGSNVPAADNSSLKGRKLNRRIEIALVPFETEEPSAAAKATAQ